MNLIPSEYIFLSHIISEHTPTYGNRDNFQVVPNSEIKKGDSANSSKWIFTTNHLGTHIDIPNHFVENGNTIDDYNAEFWIFKNIHLIEISCEHEVLIDEKSFIKENIDSNIEFLLIKTNYERFRNFDKYWNNNPGIAPSLASYLKNNFPKLRAIGFDFISLTSFQFRSVGKESHLAFLGGHSPILIIEDMKLSDLSYKPKEVIVLPLRVQETNGSPVTILAII